MENPIKMDDLGVPLFLETPIYTSERRAKSLSLKNLASPCSDSVRKRPKTRHEKQAWLENGQQKTVRIIKEINEGTYRKQQKVQPPQMLCSLFFFETDRFFLPQFWQKYLVGANHPHLVATLCSSFNRENGHPLLICSSRSAQPKYVSQMGKKPIEFLSARSLVQKLACKQGTSLADLADLGYDTVWHQPFL